MDRHHHHPPYYNHHHYRPPLYRSQPSFNHYDHNHQFNAHLVNPPPPSYNPNHHPHVGGGPNDSFLAAAGGGSGGFRPNNDRKRPRPASPEHNDGGGYTKLYVAPVPRTITTEDMWPLFRKHGNVIEVVFPMDKRHRLRGEYCFVKYSTREEADRAIRALNGQYIIPGEALPIVVRYADTRRDNHGKVEVENTGGVAEKLYVGGINKQASKQEIREVFSVYGNVEDIYIGRDELKQSRGFAFVKFSHMDMALAAIKALHGTFRMRGCDQPLIVRFADPLKPKPGEPRLLPTFGDSVGGCATSNVSYTMQENSSNFQTQASSYLTKQASQLPQMPLQSVSPVEHLPSELPQSQAVSETEKQAQCLGQQQTAQVLSEEVALRSVNSPQLAPGASAALLVSPSPQVTDSEECDWSEHTCPDGFKYYYNCNTCESTWETPEQFASFQQRLQMQEMLPSPDRQCVSISPAVCAEEIDQKTKDGS